MKRIYLFLLIVYENLLKNVLLFFGMLISSFLLLAVFSAADEYIEVIKHVEYGNFDQYVFVGNIGDPTAYLDTDHTEELKKLGNIEVNDYYNNLFMIQGYTDMSLPYVEFNIETSGVPTYNDIQVDLYEGRMPASPNEIVLTKRALEYFSLDQKITLDYIVSAEETHPITLTITGFLDDRVLLKRFGGVLFTNASYASLLEIDSYLNYPIDRLFGFISENTVSCDDGCPITSMQTAQILTCRSASGESPDELRNRIISTFPSLSECTYTGDALHDAYIRKNQTELSQLLIEVIIIFLLICCFLIGSLYLQARKKALEMTVIYMQGMTWISSISMIFASYLPGILLGISCGIYCFYNLSDMYFTNKVVFRIEYIVISAGICLILSLLCMIPIYIELAKRSPIETIRKD